MALRARVGLIGFGLLMLTATALALAAPTDTATDLFNRAVQYDLSGEGEGSAQRAFALYQRAAEAGLPEAEFNVGVMLDSGRGVGPNVAKAATWYARAAAHGDPRGAYNLGQLYEAGEGVPRNADLARVWFAASDLPAARTRLASLSRRSHQEAVLSAATLVAPAGNESTGSGAKRLELVWTAQQTAEPVRFFVELREIGVDLTKEIFCLTSDKSSILSPDPLPPGRYAWRVLTVSVKSGHYETSKWQEFAMSAAD